MANVANVLFKKLTAAQWAALTTKDNGTFYRVERADGTGEDFYQGSNKLNGQADIDAAIEALDATVSIVDEDNENPLNITITEVDGKLTAVTGSIDANTFDTYGAAAGVKSDLEGDADEDTKDSVTIAGAKKYADDKVSALDNSLEAVAKSGEAADVSVADTAGNFTAENVEAVLAEIAGKIGDGVEGKTVYLKDESAGQTDYAKVYKLYQGPNASDMTKNTAIGTINIPLDKVLKDASLATEDAEGKKGYFLKLEFQNVDTPIYVDLTVLADIYQGAANAQEVQVTVSDYTISAAIVSVAGTKVVYKTEIDPESGESIATSVTAALNDLYAKYEAIDVDGDIDAKIAELDATVSIADEDNTNPLNIQIVETDGKLTSVTGSIDANTFDSYGAAAGVKTALEGNAETDTAASTTIEGAKKYADSLATNYDPSGSAATAQANAEDYARGLLVWEEIE